MCEHHLKSQVQVLPCLLVNKCEESTKYSLIIDKENMQAKISLLPSVDQVMQHTQNVEKGNFG